MNTRYFQKELECISEDDLRSLQLDRLKNLAAHCYENIDFYKQTFDEAGVKPEDIQSLDDLRRLPFTVKQDLRDAYPFGMFAIPTSKVARIHSSSGTTGQASVVGYSHKDLDVWGDCFARALVMAGGNEDSLVQVSYGLGLFTGGLGAVEGARRLHATTLPLSTGNTKRQIQIMKDFGTDILCCTPSYALYIAESAEAMGLNPATDFKISGLVCGAEPSSENLRATLAEKFDAEYVDIYGLSEIMGPGVAAECSEKQGLHINEDCFIFEILDPITLEPVPDGEYGEVVITTLCKECSPLIRYRTKDISRIIPGKCGCGRTTKRLDHIQGRSDDMLIIRGVNVYPSQIEQELVAFSELTPNYRITLTKEGPLDKALVEVETAPDFEFDTVKSIENLQKKISNALKSNLQIAVVVKLVEPKTIQRSEGKSVHVVDLRGE